MKVNNLPCIDVESLYRQLTDQGKPYSHFANCNHIILRSGSEPSTGRLLLRRKEYDNANFSANHGRLSIALPGADGKTITLAGFHLVQATEVIPTADDASAAPIMVSIADVRGLGAAIDKGYNLRDAGTGIIYPATKNGGALWTWATALNDLWTAAGLTGTPTAPGSYPGGKPENLNYYGYANGFEALEEFLKLCGWTLSPKADGTFTIVKPGDASTAPGAKWMRKFDSRFAVKPQPYKIRVRFPKIPEPIDGSSTWYTVDTTTGSSGGGTIQLTDPLAYSGTNSAACAAQAAVRVAGYQAETNQDTAAVYRDYWPVTNIGQKFAAVCYSFRGFGRETELMVKNSEVVDVDVPKLKTGSGIPDCSVQINTCTIDKYVGVLASNYQLSDTTFTQDGGSPAVFQKGAGGITVKYKGWCGPVEGATWSSGTATITSAGHPLTTGDIITVTGVDPGEYNVSNVPVTATTTDTISYAMVDDPGSYVSGGSVSAPNVVYCIENPTNCCYTSQSLTCCTLPSRPFTFPSNLVLTITNQTGFVVNLPTTTSFFPWTYFPGTGYGVQWLTTIPQILGTDADGVYGIIVSLNIFCEAGIVYLVIQINEPRGGSCATAFTAVGPNYTLGLPPYLGTPGLPVTIIHRVFDCDGKWDPGTGAGELLATFESGCASNTTFDLRIRR